MGRTKTPFANDSHKPKALPVKFKAGFLGELDRRTDLARTLQSNYDQIVADVGGRGELSHIKASLIERYVWLEVMLQTLEAEMAQGSANRSEVLARWIQAINSLSGLAKVLGIERRTTAKPWLSTATPVVSSPEELEDK